MSGNPLDRYLGKSPSFKAEPKSDALYVGSPPPPVSPSLADGFMADGQATTRMLDLVGKSGERTGLPYAYLVCVKLQGNAKLELTFTE